MNNTGREYREFELRTAQGEDNELIVEGYAAVTEQETVLYKYDGIEYKEIIDRNAFSGADLTDVVMNYNHGGKPVARTRNNTLQLFVDDKGLHIRAILSGTEEGRRLHEEIKGGYIDRMSFAFTVAKDSYDRNSHTRRILAFERIYDVAAVDCPAYDTTELSARSFFSAQAEHEKAEQRSRRVKKLKLKLEVQK